MELCTPDSPRLRGLALALTALNLSRGSLARPRVQAEIHLLLAARLRLSWPRLPRSEPLFYIHLMLTNRRQRATRNTGT